MPNPSKLIAEYAASDNIKSAAYRSGYTVAAATALLNDPIVIEQVAARREEIAQAVFFNASRVIQEWIDIATADPSELSAVHAYCCRNCHGVEHRYQWTEDELIIATASALERRKEVPDCTGGLGFDARLPPHPECPVCRGHGHNEVVLADTRNLSPKAAKLFAGAKVTRNGIEIAMRNQDAALDNIAKYLGMLINRNELTGKDGKAISINRSIEDMSDEELLLIAASGKPDATTE